MRFTPSRFGLSAFVSASVGFLVLATSLAAGVNPPGFPPFPQGQYQPAGLGPKEPDLEIDFPGGASNRGIAQGMAVVSILIDATGKATDYLLTGCTDMVFGKRLLDQVKTIDFQAARFKGVPVPSRFNLVYNFHSRNTAVSPMDAARNRMEEATGIKLSYTAATEKELDKSLEFTNAVWPRLPEGYQVTDKNPVKVFVTFYIDEEGRVRVPNVESAASPELIPGALAAVQQWTLKPATVKGKAAIVFTGRAVRFFPRDATGVQPGGTAK